MRNDKLVQLGTFCSLHYIEIVGCICWHSFERFLDNSRERHTHFWNLFLKVYILIWKALLSHCPLQSRLHIPIHTTQPHIPSLGAIISKDCAFPTTVPNSSDQVPWEQSPCDVYLCPWNTQCSELFRKWVISGDYKTAWKTRSNQTFGLFSFGQLELTQMIWKPSTQKEVII